jgi:hypothetical protein
MADDLEVGGRPAGDQMFLNDPFEDGRVTLAVPSAFRIHDGDGSSFANPKTVRLGAKNSALFGEAELLQAPLEKLPRRQAAFLVTAFRSRLVAAEKNVPPRDGHADRGGDFLLSGRHRLEVLAGS